MSGIIESLLKYRPTPASLIKAGVVIGIGAAVLYFAFLTRNREQYHPGILIDILSKYHNEVAFVIAVGVTMGIVAAIYFFPYKVSKPGIVQTLQ
jgi:hypothetical protein